MIEVIPSELKLVDEGKLQIRWSDDSIQILTPAALRKACPCATCREKRQAESDAASQPKGTTLKLPVLSTAEAQPIRIKQMRPAGNYAYNITFSDGHNSGLFTFDMLRQLAMPQK